MVQTSIISSINVSSPSSYESMSSFKTSPITTLTTSISGLSSYRDKNNYVMIYAIDRNMVFCIKLVHGNQLIDHIHVIAGNGTAGYSSTTIATRTMLNKPLATVVDANNEFLYISDTFNNIVRVIDMKIDKISLVAGIAQTSGFGGDGGQATSALLNQPNSIGLSPDGSFLYIADTENNRIRRVTLSSGIIMTIAGSGATGSGGDGGPATSANLYLPRGVAVDFLYQLYISDTENSRIRKVSSSGNGTVISTVAGNGTATGDYYNMAQQDGVDGTVATLYYPRSIAFDSTYSNLYITDVDNNRIRRLEIKRRKIFTVGGSTSSGQSSFANGVDATSSSLHTPMCVAVDGNFIYIADSMNKQIRMIATSNTQSMGDESSYSGAIAAAIIALVLGTGYFLYRLFHYEKRMMQIHISLGSMSSTATFAMQNSPLHYEKSRLHKYRASWESDDGSGGSDSAGSDLESCAVYRISVSDSKPTAKL